MKREDIVLYDDFLTERKRKGFICAWVVVCALLTVGAFVLFAKLVGAV